MSCCSKTEMIVSGEYDMPGVPADVAEQVFRAVDKYPNFVPQILSTEFLRGKPSTVGACWLEGRIFDGEEIVIRKSITEMSKNPYYTVRATAEMESKQRCWTPNFMHTFTFVIEPKTYEGGKEGCTTKWNIAYLAMDFCSSLISKLFSSRDERTMHRYVDEEMKCFYDESLRRLQDQDMTASETNSAEKLSEDAVRFGASVGATEQTSYPRRTVPKQRQ